MNPADLLSRGGSPYKLLKSKWWKGPAWLKENPEKLANRVVTCAATPNHITIILKSLPKPGDDTLGDSKFLGNFQVGTSTFQSFNNSTT
ncbi:hypothetical protein TNCV_4657591 [Trichonephila clavipes]|nr:hypothetical protein TNCV_4657591 [Trichonephila clavipes]